MAEITASEWMMHRRAESYEQRQLRKKRILEDYGPLFPWLCKLLYRHDPVRLAGCGAPKDEYKSEAYLILPELERLLCGDKTEPDDIRLIVYRAFEDMFNRSPDPPYRYHHTCGCITDEVYTNIASEIAIFIQEGGFVRAGEAPPP